MKIYVRNSTYVSAMAKVPSVGIFWYITDTDELLTFPYDPDNHVSAISKNGLSYTHKKLWPEIAGKFKKYPYNYFPRGRVEIDNKGRSVVYMNPNVPDSALSSIKQEFGVRGDIIVKYDNSQHYKCHLDDGWKPDNSK